MPAEGTRVLYVDDDPGIARLVEKALGRGGYDVVLAGDTGKALAILDEGGIDAVGLDHFMPGGTGIDLLRALKERKNAPPVVYVTSAGDTRVAVTALKEGAADYVPKDVGGVFLELLASSIDGAIEQARMRREKEAAEEAVRRQRDRAEMLLREVNHRVGNSLALVGALVRIQAGALQDPAAIAALKETQSRINAIAGVHRRLYRSGDVRFVELQPFLSDLVQELETMMSAEGRPQSVRLTVESDLQVTTDKAVSIGVVVNELLTNAYKYAYPDGQAGEIRVLFGRDDTHATLVVEDDGVGWEESTAVAGTGIGTQVVRSMALNLGAELSLDKEHRGTRVILRLPMGSGEAE